MQVTETRTEGFHREFEVVLPKADLAAKVDAQLGEMKQRAQIPGFRPGKVPVDASQAPLWPPRRCSM